MFRSCYACKGRYSKLHFFYDQFCPDCAEFNYKKRQQSVDLTGKVAIVTGGRVKIGYEPTRASCLMVEQGFKQR